ncbi:MAG TPA: hypothetical protein VGF65_06545 [Mycobacterium sp.]|jgi:hypothetical protein
MPADIDDPSIISLTDALRAAQAAKNAARARDEARMLAEAERIARIARDAESAVYAPFSPDEMAAEQAKAARVADRQRREDLVQAEVDNAVESLGGDVSGVAPRDILLVGARSYFKAGLIAKACEFADKVAPYVHPRLQSVTTAAADPDDRRTDDDLLAEIEEIRARQAAIKKPRRVHAPSTETVQ